MASKQVLGTVLGWPLSLVLQLYHGANIPTSQGFSWTSAKLQWGGSLYMEPGEIMYRKDRRGWLYACICAVLWTAFSGVPFSQAFVSESMLYLLGLIQVFTDSGFLGFLWPWDWHQPLVGLSTHTPCKNYCSVRVQITLNDPKTWVACKQQRAFILQKSSMLGSPPLQHGSYNKGSTQAPFKTRKGNSYCGYLTSIGIGWCHGGYVTLVRT